VNAWRCMLLQLGTHWIAVGELKPMAVTALRSGRERCSAGNELDAVAKQGGRQTPITRINSQSKTESVEYLTVS
jgi:hypothetical protein